MSLPADSRWRRLRKALLGRTSLAVVAQAFARVASFVSSFAIVPMALHHVGNERYGLWMAATSFVMMLATYGDGGVGNSLVATAAKAMATSGAAGVRRAIASAYAVVAPMACAGILISACAAWLLPWKAVFGVGDELANETAAVVFVVGALASLGFLPNVAMRARAGLNQLAAASVWDAAASLSAIPALAVAIAADASLPAMVAAVMGMPFLVKCLGVAVFFASQPQLRPGVRDIEKAGARDALGGGSVFLVIALSQAAAIQSDQFLIGALAGAGEVAAYSVMQRLFTIPYIVASLLFGVRWPAIAAAHVRKDRALVRRIFLQMLAIGWGVSLILSIGLAVFHRPILDLWVGGKIVPDAWLLGGMAVYAVLVVGVGAFSTLFVGLDLRRAQMSISLAMVVVNLPLSIFLIHRIGAAGAIWGTAIAYLVAMLVPYVVIARRHLAPVRDLAA